ncbi:MAG: hypothetical protein JEZ07_00925 [Phycisphaerae bacterium]|nr:hypothetical protein [Phycisphaerae bacterium]
MKTCKHCKKEIEQLASKCPYCQGVQNWYKDPQVTTLLPMLVVFYFIFGSSGLFNKKVYTDYKEQITFEKLSTSSDDSNIIHTYNIKNNTKYKWESISYQYVGTDEKGQVMKVKSEQEYRWVVQPNDSSMLSILIEKNSPIKKWELKIIDMESGRF